MTFAFECNGLDYTASASWFDDGRLAELFLSNHKSNSAADATHATPRSRFRSHSKRRRGRDDQKSAVPRRPRPRQRSARVGARFSVVGDARMRDLRPTSFRYLLHDWALP